MSSIYERGPWHWPPADSIRYYFHVYNGLLELDREAEIIDGKPDTFRLKYGYYERSRSIQSLIDYRFQRELPDAYQQVIDVIKPENERWERTVALYRGTEAQLRALGLDGYIGDCRAKSAFSFWDKKEKKVLDPDEIFDVYGIRFVATTIEQASQIVAGLQTGYPLMDPHPFRHRGTDVHIPIRGDLKQPNERGYAALRMNLRSGDTIFEAHVLTRDAYLQHQRFLLERAGKTHPSSNLLIAREVADDHKNAGNPQSR